MYDLEIIKRTAIRLKHKPADIVLSTPVQIFNTAWNVFLETVGEGPAHFKARFDYEEQNVKGGLPIYAEPHQSIHQATRYASMAYLSCGLAMAERQQNSEQMPQAAVTHTISRMAHKLAVMNTYVHAFMGKLHADRSYLVNPLNPKLREALSDYYTVVVVALLEIKPYASQAADTQHVIHSAIEDSIIIAQKNGLDLNISRDVLKRFATDVAMNSATAPSQFPPATSRALTSYREDIVRAAYKATAKAEPAPEPERPSATVLSLEKGRTARAQRLLVEAAKRVNPKDPGHTPKP